MSRHTEPMTDAYIAAERLRNAARVQCKIEQLGSRWLLHPDNAVTFEAAQEARRARVEVVDTRRLREAGFSPIREAFQRAAEAMYAFARHHAMPAMSFNMRGRRPLLIEHDGGAQ